MWPAQPFGCKAMDNLMSQNVRREHDHTSTQSTKRSRTGRRSGPHNRGVLRFSRAKNVRPDHERGSCSAAALQHSVCPTSGPSHGWHGRHRFQPRVGCDLCTAEHNLWDCVFRDVLWQDIGPRNTHSGEKPTRTRPDESRELPPKLRATRCCGAGGNDISECGVSFGPSLFRAHKQRWLGFFCCLHVHAEVASTGGLAHERFRFSCLKRHSGTKGLLLHLFTMTWSNMPTLAQQTRDSRFSLQFERQCSRAANHRR